MLSRFLLYINYYNISAEIQYIKIHVINPKLTTIKIKFLKYEDKLVKETK